MERALSYCLRGRLVLDGRPQELDVEGERRDASYLVWSQITGTESFEGETGWEVEKVPGIKSSFGMR